MHGWTSRQRNAAIASFLSWTLDAFDFFLLVFLLSDIAHSFHVDLEEVTLAILLTLAVRPVGALIFGRAAEKFGRKPILMLNIVFFSAFELLSAAAPSLMLFFLLRVLYGVAMGGIWGVASSLAMETIPDRSRGLMSGLFQAGYPFGYLLAAVAYGLLFTQLGWRGMFVIGAAPVLLLPFIYFCVEESPVWLAARQSKASTALLPVLRSHWKLCLYLVVLMAAFNFFSHGTQDLYPVFLKVQHGFEPKTVSIIAVCYNIASIIGGVFFGSLSEKIGRRKAIMSAALLALPVIPLWAFASGSLALGAGAFLMQFMVQGAWGVIPTWLNVEARILCASSCETCVVAIWRQSISTSLRLRKRTFAPSCSKILSSAVTSEIWGIFSMRQTPSTRRAAGMMATAAFFAPLMRTSPKSG